MLWIWDFTLLAGAVYLAVQDHCFMAFLLIMCFEIP